MTAVYVLRHPQTTWNAAHRYQGRLEAPLSAEGRAQLRLVVRAFAGESLDAVYSSPLERALVLGRALAHEADSPVCIDERLIELGQGEWEGLHVEEIQRRFPDIYHDWYARPDTVRFPHGESLADVQGRALPVLADLFRRYPAGKVAVVTHGVVAQMLVSTALGLDMRYLHRVTVSNGGISTICGVEMPGQILCINNTDALYRTPVASAAQHECSTWKQRTVTQ